MVGIISNARTSVLRSCIHGMSREPDRFSQGVGKKRKMSPDRWVGHGIHGKHGSGFGQVARERRERARMGGVASKLAPTEGREKEKD